jgi:D-lactate dehydrogenase
MTINRYNLFHDRIGSKIEKKRIFNDYFHTLAFGTDASFYRLIPEIVIKANNEEEVSFILKVCSDMNIPVTFRAAGTSLSGQAITDSVLVIAGNNWDKYSTDADCREVTMQPGITGGRINSYLLPSGKKIGPDPASVNSAMIGGIAANNASGMCCGTALNSYQTLSGIRLVLVDGTILDTRDKKSRTDFTKSHSAFLKEIESLAASARGNRALAERIKSKYKIKNTTGYSLNALIDFSDPFDIIAHLIIGSEGTLGFISEITLKTVEEHRHKATSLMIFPDIVSACSSILILKSLPVSAAELIDRTGLKSVENEQGMPSFLRMLDENACALLVETVNASESGLDLNINKITSALQESDTVFPVYFTSKKEEYEKLWKIRKGLFPSAGAMRKDGTTVIIEDVAFPLNNLAEATADLRKILIKYGYYEAVIFGHALAGNLHFVFSQDFSSKQEIERYSGLMNEVCDMVVNKYSGSLKAEHGTGRNMAPFVEMEWGHDAYFLMKEIKRIFDPRNILNPGVILNDNREVYIQNFKPAPLHDDITGKCIECGFCEPSCVSAGLTLSPRQRIVIHREMMAISMHGGQPHRTASLAKHFSYEADATCATDGLCALACPVKIDCGKMIKKIRQEHVSKNGRTAMWIADHMAIVTSFGRRSLTIVDFFHMILGSSVMKGISAGIRTVSGNTIPSWNKYMPSGATRIKPGKSTGNSERKVVYMPSCINRTMGISDDHREEKQLSEKIEALLTKAGYEIIYPENLNDLCCGMAFLSKGYTEAGMKKSKQLENALLKASDEGRIPVLCDMSPCLYTMRDNITSLKLYEPVEFINDYVIQHLNITPVQETVAVFPVCSTKKMGLEEKLISLAGKCAKEVVVPETNCCGFAGDRGFSYPELNRHGLRHLGKQIPENVKHGYSNSRTCESGLGLHSGISWKSIVYLVDSVSTEKTE